MRILAFTVFLLSITSSGKAQSPQTYNSSEILLQLKKLNVLGSVMYIAAHPDDENNALLPYLAKEKLYRTAYLSLTRGDGGQNLIGDEQGIDLGLIRTQELLAARRIDGAEQYFSSAYEFGFSKSADEALHIWNKEKILADVVWMIRKYQPDIIIKRFPGDARAGHGHHAASALIADEAFIAAADPNRFPEQLTYGLKPWQAKRILWNTYNFGSNNTTSDDQFKMDIGTFNPILGKSYGEIGAEARTMHKSQGEGRPRRRGQIMEFFSTTGGDPARNSLMDGIDTTWMRIAGAEKISTFIDSIIAAYKPDKPELSVPALTKLYGMISRLPDVNWRNQKLEEVKRLLEACGGLFMEVTAQNQLNVIGDSIKLTVGFNNRTGIAIDQVKVDVFGNIILFDKIKANDNNSKTITVAIPKDQPATQPYWLEHAVEAGRYLVDSQGDVGKAENDGYEALFEIKMDNAVINYSKKVLYKYTDPVKGELYEPIQLVNPVFINSKPSVIIFSNGIKNQSRVLNYSIQPNIALADKASFHVNLGNSTINVFDTTVNFLKGATKTFPVYINSDSLKDNSSVLAAGELSAASLFEHQYFSLRKISYDHIPDLFYNYMDATRVIKMDLKTKGKLVGYIMGAGDKVPQSLEAMGYDVRILSEDDITDDNLKKFDAIITGIRAYNISEYLTNKNEILNRYVQNGGNLIVQYLKSNQVGQKKIVAGPYPFTIDAGSRVTEEDAPVSFLLPEHSALNYPNKITAKDFEGWNQERSTYQAVKTDDHFEMLIGMNDKADKPSNGSLAIAKYGKGNFVYASLVFFRQLPAGVPGAYRLMANLIALPKNK